MSSVLVERFIGRAGEFHSREIPADRDVHVWWFEPTVDALVLGSTQDESLIDVDACRRFGVDIVRRRSGGGLVLLDSDGTLWLDVVMPVEHPTWDRDVMTSSLWLGELWMRALSVCGLDSLVQHRSRLERTPLSDLVCFAGRGPGEVFLLGESAQEGAKVVGISQRRTRTHARFQSVVSIRWRPQRLVDLLGESSFDLDDIERSGSTIDVNRERLIEAMTELLIEQLG